MAGMVGILSSGGIMSNLSDRRNSPRRRNIDRGGGTLAVRVAVLLYVPLPLLVFVANGSWQAGCIAMVMLWWVFRPLRKRLD
jgi:hypothetical protein